MRKLFMVGLLAIGLSLPVMAMPGKGLSKGRMGMHSRHRLMRMYCEENPKSVACAKMRKVMQECREKIRNARQMLISEMRGYCQANPKARFCKALERVHGGVKGGVK